MRLFCRDCGKPIDSDDVNIALAIAKCASCGSVFHFAEQIGAASAVTAAKPTVATPNGVRIENWGSELTLSYRWYTHAVWMLVVFCLVWDGFLIGWYTALAHTFKSGHYGTGEIIALVFPVFHILIGLGLTYACLTSFFNNTIIKASHGELSVWHGPLPCHKSVRLVANDVRQIFCTRREHRGRNTTSITYDVVALLYDGAGETLVQNLSDYARARYIEQELEKHLSIVDERMPAEVTA
jgi:hypothetical protein